MSSSDLYSTMIRFTVEIYIPKTGAYGFLSGYYNYYNNYNRPQITGSNLEIVSKEPESFKKFKILPFSDLYSEKWIYSEYRSKTNELLDVRFIRHFPNEMYTELEYRKNLTGKEISRNINEQKYNNESLEHIYVDSFRIYDEYNYELVGFKANNPSSEKEIQEGDIFGSITTDYKFYDLNLEELLGSSFKTIGLWNPYDYNDYLYYKSTLHLNQF